eukprot:89836-Heterocapsa_arctica.AAC.1
MAMNARAGGYGLPPGLGAPPPAAPVAVLAGLAPPPPADMGFRRVHPGIPWALPPEAAPPAGA